MSRALDASVGRFLDWVRETSPLEATTLGIHDQDHRVDSMGAEREVHADHLRDILRGIPSPADPDDALDAAAFRAHLAETLIGLEEMDLPARSAGCMIEEFLNAVFHQVNGSYAPPAERFRALLYRLRDVQRLLGQVLLELRKSAAHGRVPRAWTAHGMEVAEDGAGYLRALRREVPGWLPARRLAPLRRALAEELTRAARALLEFQKDVRRQVLPRSSPRAYAAGAELFSKILAAVHLMPSDPGPFDDEAESETRETLARLESLSLKLCGVRNWHEADRRLSDDHPPASGLIAAFRNDVRRLHRFAREKKLTRMDGTDTLALIETPPYERSSIPYAAYQGPAPLESGDRRGYFFVTPPDHYRSESARLRHLREFPTAAICLTAAHEGIPGHHLQHLLAHASPRPVRRIVWDSFFGEGWAHYSEGLILQEGFTADERSEFFLLKDRLWRCVRVGLDVRIHTRGMALAQAAAALARDAGLSKESAWGEAVRYSLEPTQPMSYFVGRKFFERLLADERRRAGPRFDLAAFHDRILSYGSVPLPLIRRRIRPRS